MTPVFTARRQAAEFESGLSGGLVLSSLSRSDAASLAPLFDLVSQLQAVAPPAPRADYLTDLRARLMVEADSVLVTVDTAAEARLRLTPSDPTARRRERRLATVLGGAALIGATASVAVAAQGALPGQTLYPVKRAIENVRTDVSTSDGAKASMLLANASGRLDEIDQLAREGSAAGIAALPGTLDTFSDQAGQAAELLLDDYRRTGREGSITELRDFTGESMTMLARLEGTLPDGARDELLHAARTVAAYDARANAACPTCAGAGVTEMPSVLASAGISTAVTIPASLPGIELPTPTNLPGDSTKGYGKGNDTGGTDDVIDTVPVPVPEPPTLPPTKTPDPDIGKDTTKTATDVIDTITGTLTGATATDGGVVGGVVVGVEDVVKDTAEVVDGTIGTVGGLTGGLTNP
ncbi:MAG: hypothetical protein H0X12_00430 [Nocardioides sp.]|nr:hypothetical protein [Nocardioides sp.]